VKYIVGKCVRS